MDLARRDGMVEEMGMQLRQHTQLLQTHGDLQKMLNNPSVDMQVKTNILAAILERTQPAPLLRSFLQLLLARNRLQHLELICTHYEKMANELLGRVTAQVTTAVALDARQRQDVQQKIARMTQKEVLLETRVDPSILGGLIVRVDNVVLDGSLQGQLARLRKELVGG
jgi:F-type H+-transporting ATPase subunit delta